jgi:hypothetical protein
MLAMAAWCCGFTVLLSKNIKVTLGLKSQLLHSGDATWLQSTTLDAVMQIHKHLGVRLHVTMLVYAACACLSYRLAFQPFSIE